jgi:hypothetical protein
MNLKISYTTSSYDDNFELALVFSMLNYEQLSSGLAVHISVLVEIKPCMLVEFKICKSNYQEMDGMGYKRHETENFPMSNIYTF